ncbi:hypothetical protein SMMN14_01705 [Sphaerulina musiva]
MKFPATTTLLLSLLGANIISAAPLKATSLTPRDAEPQYYPGYCSIPNCGHGPEKRAAQAADEAWKRSLEEVGVETKRSPEPIDAPIVKRDAEPQYYPGYCSIPNCGHGPEKRAAQAADEA